MKTTNRKLEGRWTLTGAVLVCVGALLGCKGSAPAADPDRCPPSASTGTDSAGAQTQDVDPREPIPEVVARVDLVARVTVIDDVVAVSPELCSDHTYPAFKVRARVDEVMYVGLDTKLAPDEVPAVGDEIEITAVGTLDALSAAQATDSALSEAIVALRVDAPDPLQPDAKAAWLADGTGRVAPASTIDDWKPVIERQVESDRGLAEFRAEQTTETT